MASPDPDVDWDALRSVAVRTARAILRDSTEAQDVAQDAMIALVVFIRSTGVPPRNCEAWVTTVAQRRALNRLRKDKGEAGAKSRIAGQSLEPASDPADRVVARILVGVVLDQLSERQREALIQVVVLGFDHLTVAQAMEITPQTLKTHLRRARETVRQRHAELSDRGGDA